jgi:hypothetical protein
MANEMSPEGDETQNQTTCETNEGGEQTWDQKYVKHITSLVHRFQALLQRYIRYDRWGAPIVNHPVLGMRRYPYAMSILLSTRDAVAFHEPILHSQHPGFLVEGFDAALDEVNHWRVTLGGAIRQIDVD